MIQLNIQTLETPIGYLASDLLQRVKVKKPNLLARQQPTFVLGRSSMHSFQELALPVGLPADSSAAGKDVSAGCKRSPS